MAFRFPHFTSQKENSFLIFRIGKEEIDFLLFQKEISGVRILAYGAESISYLNVRQTLEKIFTQLPQKENIRELIVTFSASQFQAQGIQQTLPRSPSSHLIDRAEALLLEGEIRAKSSRVFQRILFQESGILPGEFSLRKIKILERRIDGYPVPKFEGFKRGEIECSILGMFLLEIPFLPVEQFAKSHKIRNIRVLHIAEAIESLAKKRNQEGVYLCVEEEKTQIALQKEGHFVFLGSISMGEDNFTEFFGHLLGMRETTAEAFQEQYFRGDLSQTMQEKVQTSLLPEIRKFGILIKKKLSSAKMVLPSFVWIFGKGRALRNIQYVFGNEEFEDLPFSQKPEVSFLLPKEVWEVKEFPGGNDPVYTTLCLLGFASESCESRTR